MWTNNPKDEHRPWVSKAQTSRLSLTLCHLKLLHATAGPTCKKRLGPWEISALKTKPKAHGKRPPKQHGKTMKNKYSLIISSWVSFSWPNHGQQLAAWRSTVMTCTPFSNLPKFCRAGSSFAAQGWGLVLLGSMDIHKQHVFLFRTAMKTHPEKKRNRKKFLLSLDPKAHEEQTGSGKASSSATKRSSGLDRHEDRKLETPSGQTRHFLYTAQPLKERFQWRCESFLRKAKELSNKFTRRKLNKKLL